MSSHWFVVVAGQQPVSRTGDRSEIEVMRNLSPNLMNRTVRILGVLVLVAISLLGPGPGNAVAESQQVLPTGRWIGVNLDAHTATAYEWSTPLYTAPVTAGKPGWETPTGTFYIQYRVWNETMDSATVGIPRGAAEGYYLPGVRYTQYFTWSGYALHSNYWMPDSYFGTTNSSHGCVGMRLADAEYFWYFATVGTPIVIYQGPRSILETAGGGPLPHVWGNEAE